MLPWRHSFLTEMKKKASMFVLDIMYFVCMFTNSSVNYELILIILFAFLYNPKTHEHFTDIKNKTKQNSVNIKGFKVLSSKFENNHLLISSGNELDWLLIGGTVFMNSVLSRRFDWMIVYGRSQSATCLGNYWTWDNGFSVQNYLTIA